MAGGMCCKAPGARHVHAGLDDLLRFDFLAGQVVLDRHDSVLPLARYGVEEALAVHIDHEGDVVMPLAAGQAWPLLSGNRLPRGKPMVR